MAFVKSMQWCMRQYFRRSVMYCSRADWFVKPYVLFACCRAAKEVKKAKQATKKPATTTTKVTWSRWTCFLSLVSQRRTGVHSHTCINVYLGPPVSNFMLRSKELNFLFSILTEGGWCAQCSLCYVLLRDCVLQAPQQCSCHTWSHRATGDHSTGPWRLHWHYTIGRPPYSPTS